MREEDDPLAYALANHCMALICYYTHALRHGERYRRKVIEIIERNNIRFLPRSDTPEITSELLPYSETTHERAAFLAEQIYSETNIHLVIGYREQLCEDLERQFRFEFPVLIFTVLHFHPCSKTIQNACPVLFQICPLILRVRSILFFKDANDLIKSQGMTYRLHSTL